MAIDIDLSDLNRQQPEKTRVRVGYIPLADCAPVLLAAELGFDCKYGIEIEPVQQASWAQLRDGLVTGQLDAAHALYGLIYGSHLGIGCPATPMAVLMGLNRNGQAITLANRLAEQGVCDGPSLKALLRSGARPTLAHTATTGTHAMWLCYWLAAQGIHPLQDLDLIALPPQRMVAALQTGQIQGFCAGEPWNALAIAGNAGFTVTTSQAIWPDHPEKVLGVCASWLAGHRHTARALMAAVLDSCRWLDEQSDPDHVIDMLAAPEVIGLPRQIIADRFMGRYQDGLGRQWHDAHPLCFFDHGQVNFPWLSDGLWFIDQFRRWGLIRGAIDPLTEVSRLQQTALYRSAAALSGVSVPAAGMRTSTLVDGRVWAGHHWSEPEPAVTS